MRINICLISDENFIQHLAVAMASILSNADIDDDLYFYLLLSENVSETDKQKILNLKNIKNCNIIFVNVNVAAFKGYALKKRAANFKFFIGDILKDLDKVLYLDCDIVVLSSLKNLFSENIDNYYIAAVEDYGYYYLNLHLDYNITDFYINTGVMLINLDLWRKDNLAEKLISLKEKYIKNFVFIDQDVINLCCVNKIKEIPLEYNFQHDFFYANRKFRYHPLNNKIKSIKNIKILHYTTPDKPWKAYCPAMKYYYKFLKMTDFKMHITVGLIITISVSYIKYIFKYIICFIAFLVSPIIIIFKKNSKVKVKLFKTFEFNLFKIKNKYLKY